MQDRFKFRAWDIEEKKMNYFQNKRGMQYNNDEIRISNGWDGYDNPKYWGGDDEDYVDRTDKYILMQCTGLKDKNGKLIYEGDIIEWKKENHIVIFDERNATFGIKISDVETHLFNDIHTPTRWIEVIGNIYENKELLKEE